MQNLNKVKTYLNFSIKSGKILYGVDSVLNYKKKVHLLVYDNTVSKNTIKQMNKIMKIKNCAAVLVKHTTLNELLQKDNCKVIALTNKNLADAAYSVVSEDLIKTNRGESIE